MYQQFSLTHVNKIHYTKLYCTGKNPKLFFFYHKPKRIGVTQTENNLIYIMRSNRTIISCRDYSIYEKNQISAIILLYILWLHEYAQAQYSPTTSIIDL